MRLLIVGESSPELDKASSLAVARGAEVRRVRDSETALRCLREGQGAELLLIDVRQDIRLLVDQMAAERIHLPIVAYGINAEPRLAVAAIRAGAREFLPLPPDPDLIAALLEAVSESGRQLVSEDPRMLDVLALARQFAPTDACVLVTGESGTGKEMMARFLHQHSRRARSPFVAVNCAAIPENLLESELFGHEKGAFTGAVARRIGKFEEADGGTLLLDEISEMEPRLQAKLLRAVQERVIDRVGGAKPVRVDIRLSPPATATSRRPWPKAASARTCCSGSASSPSSFPLCASGRATSRRWPATSPAGSPQPTASTTGRSHVRQSTGCCSITGRATSASWRTACTVPSSWPAATGSRHTTSSSARSPP